ncbi:YndM family protein [Priestia endophytica]|jgi:hypothetical protein|uniref:DUF2512 family protein n=1 Tax=Priestia endophytica TaxID=135735 RepID=A0AAX1Q5J6_9BACI|nr:YndM family protein [Priestia endophytica]KAB2495344.1 DUF2512 family protein [Priestia endophytica]MCM3537607.1 YndM family protein [Priestia endophytica]RAS72659.1 hypothetical protein A4U60_25740 [Priestia endophytica]RAS73473.1 hypothetical protein A3864_20305 [Priestia endophytica]RAS79126.1 hypothetical protein A4R27_14975 [Priestia endophytica]
MNHLKALLVKFICSIVAFAIALDLFFDATIVDILSFSLFVTVASYLIGDQIILRRLGNREAIIVEFLLTYMSVWIFGSILFDSYPQVAWGSILSALIITGAEVLVHRYFLNYVPKERKVKDMRFKRRLAYSTEMAKETDIHNKNEPE